MSIKLWIITPCFNEEANIQRCYEKVKQVFAGINDVSVVHLFADNASTDDSQKILEEIAVGDPSIRIILNATNVGPFRNMASALQHVSPEADFVVPMIPADLQDPPEEIPRMLQLALSENKQIVYGIRRNRQEKWTLRLARHSYYFLLKRLGAHAPPAHAGEFMVISKRVLDFVNSSSYEHPYVRGIVAQSGFPSTSIEYDWQLRQQGKSRNSWFDLVDQGLNGIIKTTRTPARIALFMGVVLAFSGFGLAVFTAVTQIFGLVQTTPGIPTLLIVSLLLAGSQLVFLGIVGEYVLDIHAVVHRKPVVPILKKINFSEFSSEQ